MNSAQRKSTIDLSPSPVFKTHQFNPILETPITDPLYDILFFQHHNAPEDHCYITIGEKTSNDKWFQKNFSPSQLEEGLKKFGQTNVFYSMNNFYLPFRQQKWIKEIRSLYVDLDFYKIDSLKGFTPELIRQKIDLEYVDEGKIPVPSGTRYSGNGLQLQWLLEPVAGINGSARRLWAKLQKKFCELLKELGADPQAIDIPRAFRVAGTINYKEQYGSNRVYLVQHHTHLYSMSQLADDYLPEIKHKQKAPQKIKKNKSQKKSKSKVNHLFNGYSLNQVRLEDLKTLARLRRGEFPKMRQYAVWLYRMFALQTTQNPDKALSMAYVFNDSLADPLSDDEVTWHTKSAEKKWMAEKDQSDANNLVRGYTITNEKIIEILGITSSEQKEMKTIIGKEEKKIRNQVAHEKYRRNKGQISRVEYVQTLKAQSNKKKGVLAKLLQKHPHTTIRELSSMTGYSTGTISKLKKEIHHDMK